ncbi:uncharacterized protein TNCV_2688901 [Trichonephila clavipes]|nr:uncharacterized protein TNCV_2688901 [Trichonephila clavipes]
MLPKELHQLKYEALSVPEGSVRLVKKTQERKSSTCYLLITKGVTSSRPVPLLTRRIVRVQYFVRGGFVGHRSRASSKHLYSQLSVNGVRFLGGQKGLRCSCKMHVWVSGSPKISTAAGSGYVTVCVRTSRRGKKRGLQTMAFKGMNQLVRGKGPRLILDSASIRT